MLKINRLSPDFFFPLVYNLTEKELDRTKIQGLIEPIQLSGTRKQNLSFDIIIIDEFNMILL
jgi:hypothetical protein